MDFDEYQKKALETAVFHGKKIPPLVYCALKLTGEAGEVSEKIGKVYRDEDGLFDLTKRVELAKELGDVLWYVAAMADLLGYELSYVAEKNIEKLASRAERGVISGSGDER